MAEAGTAPVAEAAATPARPTVLFLCTGNSCRSQMAEGWARHLHGARLDAVSAGVATHGLNPNAVRVMAEAGVDISGHASKLVTDVAAATKIDLCVTVCGHAAETCPVFPGRVKRVHQGFDDPPKLAAEITAADGDADEAALAEARLAPYRRVRDEIRAFVADALPALVGLA